MLPIFSKFCTLLLRAGCRWGWRVGTWYPGFRGYPDLHPEGDRGAEGEYGGRAQRRRPLDRLPHRLRRLGRSGAVVLLREMARAVGAAAQGEVRPPFQEAIHNRLG